MQCFFLIVGGSKTGFELETHTDLLLVACEFYLKAHKHVFSTYLRSWTPAEERHGL